MRESSKIMIEIDVKRCKGCGICTAFCPKGVFINSRKRNNYGTAMPAATKQEKCIRCELCEKLCPDAAIQLQVKETPDNEMERGII